MESLTADADCERERSDLRSFIMILSIGTPRTITMTLLIVYPWNVSETGNWLLRVESRTTVLSRIQALLLTVHMEAEFHRGLGIWN